LSAWPRNIQPVASSLARWPTSSAHVLAGPQWFPNHLAQCPHSSSHLVTAPEDAHNLPGMGCRGLRRLPMRHWSSWTILTCWQAGGRFFGVDVNVVLAGHAPYVPYPSVGSGHSRTTTVHAHALRAVGAARPERLEGASQARGERRASIGVGVGCLPPLRPTCPAGGESGPPPPRVKGARCRSHRRATA
jgi:hypothetical protein